MRKGDVLVSCTFSHRNFTLNSSRWRDSVRHSSRSAPARSDPDGQPVSSLPLSVETERQRLSPARVVFAGGTGALAAARSRMRQVLPDATVQRVGGAHRYEKHHVTIEQWGEAEDY
jgi:hypothetical protein